MCVCCLIQTANADDVEYLSDVKPVLKSKCWSCHGAIRQEGGLRLDTVEFMLNGGDSGPAVQAEEPLQGELLRRIRSRDESVRMPPEGEPVSPEQIARFQTWLTSGVEVLPDERPQADPNSHWAFQPIVAANPDASRHPVDWFIDAALKPAGLERSPRADSVSLVRRLFLDLHGLPPTIAQLDHWTKRFASADTSGQQTATMRSLLDLLLASPRYGERWAQHWLDIVRYADTHGFEVNTPRPNAWPYRDYVIRAFNEDRSYDRFVLEQLAGDTVGEDAATGFLVAAAALLPGQIGKDEASKRLARQDELDEIIVGTTATFLGMTVGCARCHDHKFDPIPQADYYAMQAFFAGVRYGDRELNGPEQEARLAKARSLQPQVDRLAAKINTYLPKAYLGRTIILDDEDSERVTLLVTKNGHGENPVGSKRGYQSDGGSATRFGNLSGGRYVWFDNIAGQDTFTWNPSAEGEFGVWISWGVHGSGVHTQDARYVLDYDGDLQTTNDQQQIASANQYYFANVETGESEKKPLWSGLAYAGTHTFGSQSRLVLRGGQTGTGITADVVVLQERVAASRKADPALPKLRSPVSAVKTVEKFAPTPARFVRFESFQTIDSDKHEPCIDELEVFTTGDFPQNMALATKGTKATSSGNYSTTGRHQLKHINDGRYGNSFSWISSHRGQGWVQLEFPVAQTIDRVVWSRDRNGDFADRLPVAYRITTSIDGSNWTTVADSSDRQPVSTPGDCLSSLARSVSAEERKQVSILTKELEKLQKQQMELQTPQQVFAGKFGQPHDTFVLDRGDPEQPAEKTSPYVLTAIGDVKLPIDSDDQQRRVSLAEWITSANNPLAARVMVNRIWQYHFGFGLVETSSDFGLNGAQPSHPELLDWLATEFRNSGWSVKHIHRLILTSETYSQASLQSAGAKAIDSDNRLLWHFPSRRLEAESIRDCMLHISGQLNLKMGGPGFNLFKTRGGLSGFPPVEKFTANELRRMIYAHKIRMEPAPVFGAFDCPDAGLPTPRRSYSTTAIQALNLFNSSFVIDQAEAFAGRVEVETGEETGDQIDRAFRLCLGRLPSAEERQAVSVVVEKHGLETLCRALYNSSEFLFIP